MLTFYDKLSQDFTKLLESEYNYDTIIEVGEQPHTQLFKVHSAILYQRSSYFQQKLANTSKGNNIFNIKLPNISVKTFNVVIKYIYGGVVSLENLETSEILDLLITFNEFNFSEFTDRLQTLLIEDNASWLRLNFSHIYRISFQNEDLNALQQFCNEIIIKHPNLVFDSDDFTTLQENALISLLKHDELQLDESVIWDKVILWGKAQTPNLPSNYEQWNEENFKSLKITLENCLPHIRYFQIPSDEVLDKIRLYRKILEENLWDDIMAKFASPNRPVTSTILPPRKKLTPQLPPRKSISIPSSIINLEHAVEFSSWIDQRSTAYEITEIPYEFKLLLRGSRDGFDVKTFHKLCDNIPRLIVIIKVENSNEILGGYNPLGWKSTDDGHKKAPGSFIFSLKNENIKESILSRVNDQSNALYYSEEHGPWFYCFGYRVCDGLKKWYYNSKYNSYQPPIRNAANNPL